MPNRVAQFDLVEAAKEVMAAQGFETDFPPEAKRQLAELDSSPPSISPAAGFPDLRSLVWSSIDNDTSRDLDQIEVAEQLSAGQVRLLIGIADVDAFVPRSSPIDQYAQKQTTTVYTGVRIFPMLPEQLSTGATSLLEGADRLALVIEFVVNDDGTVASGDIYRALVQNHAQLTYEGVGAWLEGRGETPPKVAASSQLEQQLELQDRVARALNQQRHQQGALDLETSEVHAVFFHDQVVGVAQEEKNRATQLIEDFMIAANGVVARRLRSVPSIRRIVKTPERWDRIVQLAAGLGTQLPPQADARALNDFLARQRTADPDHFPDLSLSIIKLLGPGEYVLERPADPGQGHFGLAVEDYTHSTAPNRRFADVVTQRIIKSEIGRTSAPYSEAELSTIAANCTAKGDAARKVEREMSKRIAAVAMSGRVGEKFDAIVTGVTPRGTFVRVLKPHVEGLLARGAEGLDVGDKLGVKLVRTDPQRGYIDFERA
ncbi:MAG: RNB domain-containing ribonuclease [Acidobacteria bacterium]|nr:RNB domain-containing ribonuclease [Acidobacteriota bacterium]